MSNKVDNNETDDILLNLKELGPQELENIANVIDNISFYNDVYTRITNYILADYQNIDLNIVEKSSKIVDDKLSIASSFGERLLVYNKLLEPFIAGFFAEYKFLMPKQRTFRNPLMDINAMILAMHPYINMSKINNLIKDIENQTNNMKYEEKFLVYNNLAHIYLQDLIKYAHK